MTTCSNDHEMPEGAAFCPVCGAPASTGPPSAPPAASTLADSAPPNERRGPTLASFLKPPIVVALGAGVLVVALVIALIATGNGDDAHKPSTSKVPPAPADDSPAQICTKQLTAMVVDMVAHGDAGLHNELVVNGAEDPFFHQAISMTAQVGSDQYQVGASVALDRLRSSAGEACSSVLHNQVRPNYPVDGSYPGE